MRFWCLSLLFLSSFAARADLTGAARYEYIRGTEEELAHRAILKSKLNYSLGPFSLYVEGFGEAEGNEDQRVVRRASTFEAYLQEAYFEFKLDSFYLRVGRQALRWSESWTLPSLDVWTGRRYNRLFFDLLQDQLTHPTGISASYARDAWSLDFVGVGDVAPSYYPIPIPEEKTEKNTSFGGRVKADVAGFNVSLMSAQVLKKYFNGASVNYAFESMVPKFEIGSVRNGALPAPLNEDLYFGTLGVDLFLGNWIVLPQVSSYQSYSDIGQKENKLTYYLSTQWNPDRHDLQFQFFRNDTDQDMFGSVIYGYNLTDSITVAGFVQNYQGNRGLYQYYEEITGGWAFGLRLELTGNLTF